MISTMINLLKEWEISQHIDMVFLEGQGRAFSGADIRDIGEMITSSSGIQELGEYIVSYATMLNILGTMKKLLITFMDGLTFGSACGVTALSRFSIATEYTKVSFPETRMGHFCNAGSNFFLPRLNANIGKYLALTAKTVTAEDVLFSEIATHFVSCNQLSYLKKDLINLDNPNHDTINEVIEKYAVKKDHVPTSYTLHGERRNIIDRCFNFDTVAEILESLQKEGSEFSLETINQIIQGSPISIALTLEQMRIGSKLSLFQCLIMEIKPWKVAPLVPDFLKVASSILSKIISRWSCPNNLAIDFQKDILDRFINNGRKQPVHLDGNERKDYFTELHRGFGLPSEKEVEQVKQGDSLSTNKDIVTWFVNHYNK